jgi:site-specific DNA-methyltransferase (adenine-specific)
MQYHQKQENLLLLEIILRTRAATLSLSHKLSLRDYQRFTIKWLKEAYRVLKPKRHIYVCIDWRMYSYLFLWMRHVGFTPKNLIVWDKVQFGMGWQYRFQHELVIFATKGSHQVRRVAKRNISDVWSIKRIPGNKTIHPTEKPEQFFTNMIKNSSYTGELVVDFFCGSGASAAAANELNDRNFIGFEIDPQHYDTIQTRLSRSQNVEGEKV